MMEVFLRDYTHLRDQLTKNQMVVEFIKKDGSQRRIVCTLDQTMIPKDAVPSGKHKRQRPDNLITVWDLEAEQWRTVNADTIVLVQYKFS